jgi:hypothetical protein
MGDHILEKLIGLQQQLDTISTRLDALETVFVRYVELSRAIETGAPPPPPPRVN